VRYFFTCMIFFLFIGCSQKEVYTSSDAYFVVIKNSKIAIGDTGFIKNNKDSLNLQVFSVASVIFELVLKDDVCVNSLCLNKTSFNEEFFGTKHYENFVDELFHFKPIYNEKNIQKTKNGFTQYIKTKDFDISYKVEGKTLYFKDRKNKILIKLRKLK